MLLGLQDMRIAWEEPFGPIIPVIRVKKIDDAIDHCNSNNLALQVSFACTALLLACFHLLSCLLCLVLCLSVTFPPSSELHIILPMNKLPIHVSFL